jgi:twitching motility two-component system response regulator PilG
LALGFSDTETRVIKSICAVSSGRVRSYKSLDDPSIAPSVYIVNHDNAEAVEVWRKANPGESIPTVFLVARDGQLIGKYCMRRPLIPTELFKLLDQITVTELGFVPELTTLGGSVSGQADASMGVIAAASKQSGDKRFHALVVDDSPTVRKQLELSLNLLGGSVHCVESGEDALNVLEQKEFDMIFLDVVMPGADGYQVCKTIKRDKRHKNTPVVMLTSKSSPFDKVRGSLAGCNSYLTKPVQEATFREVVSKYVPA